MRVAGMVTAFLAWSLLVAGAAAGSWLAVDYAGREVGAPAAAANALLPAVSPAPTPSSTRSPTATPDVRRAPSPTASPRPTPSATPTPSPSPGYGYTSDGGKVNIRCEGTALAYWSVRPNDGWRVETSQTSVSDLQVVFTSAGRRIDAHGSCSVAGPTASTVPRPSPTST
jgi:hypothetical protein